MANKEAIMDKIVRNMKQRGFSGATRTATGLVSDGLIVSYTDKDGDAPQIGVSDATSPFLGIGVAAPGSIKIKGAGGENSIAAMLTSVENVSLLAEISGLANDIVLEEGDTTTELARIAGQSDVLGLGE